MTTLAETVATLRRLPGRLPDPVLKAITAAEASAAQLRSQIVGPLAADPRRIGVELADAALTSRRQVTGDLITATVAPLLWKAAGWPLQEVVKGVDARLAEHVAAACRGNARELLTATLPAGYDRFMAVFTDALADGFGGYADSETAADMLSADPARRAKAARWGEVRAAGGALDGTAVLVRQLVDVGAVEPFDGARSPETLGRLLWAGLGEPGQGTLPALAKAAAGGRLRDRPDPAAALADSRKAFEPRVTVGAGSAA